MKKLFPLILSLLAVQNLFASKATITFPSAGITKAIIRNKTPLPDVPESIMKKIISLSPKEFEKASGSQLNFKQRLGYRLLQLKFRKQLKNTSSDRGDTDKADKMAAWSMICAILVIPLGIFSLPASILLGSYALRHGTTKRGRAKFGIIFSSVILFVVILGAILFTNY